MLGMYFLKEQINLPRIAFHIDLLIKSVKNISKNGITRFRKDPIPFRFQIIILRTKVVKHFLTTQRFSTAIYCSQIQNKFH